VVCTIREGLLLRFTPILLVPSSVHAYVPVVQPFVHVLFGSATARIGGTGDNAFAVLFGGGLDLGLRKGIGIRLVQADWLTTEFGDQVQDSQGRVSAGIVFKW